MSTRVGSSSKSCSLTRPGRYSELTCWHCSNIIYIFVWSFWLVQRLFRASSSVRRVFSASVFRARSSSHFASAVLDSSVACVSLNVRRVFWDSVFRARSSSHFASDVLDSSVAYVSLSVRRVFCFVLLESSVVVACLRLREFFI